VRRAAEPAWLPYRREHCNGGCRSGGSTSPGRIFSVSGTIVIYQRSVRSSKRTACSDGGSAAQPARRPACARVAHRRHNQPRRPSPAQGSVRPGGNRFCGGSPSTRAQPPPWPLTAGLVPRRAGSICVILPAPRDDPKRLQKRPVGRPGSGPWFDSFGEAHVPTAGLRPPLAGARRSTPVFHTATRLFQAPGDSGNDPVNVFGITYALQNKPAYDVASGARPPGARELATRFDRGTTTPAGWANTRWGRRHRRVTPACRSEARAVARVGRCAEQGVWRWVNSFVVCRDPPAL